MRYVYSLALTLTVTAAFLFDPYVHMHLEQDRGTTSRQEEGPSAIVHMHFEAPAFPSYQHETTPVVSKGKHQSKPLSLFQCREEVPPTLPFLVEQEVLFTPTEEPRLVVQELVPRNHDPPLSDSLGSRSPPA